jgi:hypothetical protein
MSGQNRAQLFIVDKPTAPSSAAKRGAIRQRKPLLAGKADECVTWDTSVPSSRFELSIIPASHQRRTVDSLTPTRLVACRGVRRLDSIDRVLSFYWL